jgi:integrase
MKKLFTTEFVASLQPQATRYEVFDKQLAGFAVRVSTNGRLVWYVQKRYTAADLTSKVHKEVLGDTTSMSLDDARAKALEVITGLQTIPKCLPAAVQPRITVATLYDTYRSERKLSERTAKELLYTRNHLDRLGLLNIEAHTVTRHMIVESFKKVTAENGPTAANNIFGYLHTAFDYGVQRYMDEDSTSSSLNITNPCAVLGKLKLWNPKKRRNGHIKTDQLKEFFLGVNLELAKDYKGRGARAEHYRRQKYRSVSYILVSLFLGTRKSETGRLLLSNCCVTTKTLKFTNTKNGVDHFVPIGNYLNGIISRLKVMAEEEGSDYLFPSAVGAKKPHMTEPRGTLDQICEHAGIQVTMHDLRRTFASILERINVPKYTLKRLMNHIYDPARDADVTSGYVQIETEALREYVELFEAKILELAGP